MVDFGYDIRMLRDFIADLDSGAIKITRDGQDIAVLKPDLRDLLWKLERAAKENLIKALMIG